MPEPLQASYFCQTCRTPFVSSYALTDRGMCAACESGTISFDAAYCYGNYEGNLRKLIHLFKYGKVETLAQPLGRFLGTAIPLEAQFDAVMAMPMHWRKQWDRGFNQAELLARPVAQRYGLSLSGNLRRSRYTKSQAGLNEEARRKNLKDSFHVARPEQLKGKRVLVVDDVFTTGSTLRAAAECLKRAGVRHVTCLTLGRVDQRSLSGTAQSLQALRVATSAAETISLSREVPNPARKPTEVLTSTGVGSD